MSHDPDDDRGVGDEGLTCGATPRDKIASREEERLVEDVHFRQIAVWQLLYV